MLYILILIMIKADCSPEASPQRITVIMLKQLTVPRTNSECMLFCNGNGIWWPICKQAQHSAVLCEPGCKDVKRATRVIQKRPFATFPSKMSNKQIHTNCLLESCLNKEGTARTLRISRGLGPFRGSLPEKPGGGGRCSPNASSVVPPAFSTSSEIPFKIRSPREGAGQRAASQSGWWGRWKEERKKT